MNDDTERKAFEAWCSDKWGQHAYRHTSSTSGEWETWKARAAIAAAQPTKVCRGISRIGCNYLAVCDSICNKCGQLHSWRFIPTATTPAHPVEPVAWIAPQALQFLAQGSNMARCSSELRKVPLEGFVPLYTAAQHVEPVALPEDLLKLAEAHKERADDCGRLARAILNVTITKEQL